MDRDNLADLAEDSFRCAEAGFYVYDKRDERAVRGPYKTMKMAAHRKASLWMRRNSQHLTILEVVITPAPEVQHGA